MFGQAEGGMGWALSVVLVLVLALVVVAQACET